MADGYQLTLSCEGFPPVRLRLIGLRVCEETLLVTSYKSETHGYYNHKMPLSLSLYFYDKTSSPSRYSHSPVQEEDNSNDYPEEDKEYHLK